MKIKGITLHPGQLRIKDEILKSQAKFHLINASRQSGKEQPYSSLVYDLNGEKLFGNLKIGDRIFNENNKLTTVIDIFEQGEKDIYEIELKDGRKFRTGLEHLNYIWYAQSNIRNKVITTKELLNKPLFKIRENGLTAGKKEFLYFIETSKGVSFNKKEFYIDPYLLGCLIGDGSLHTGSKGGCYKITISQTELIDYLKFPNNYYISKINHTKYEYGIKMIKREKVSKFRLEIERLKLNCLSKNKFIPDEYKFCSYDQRLELLKGLMDTDGGIPKRTIKRGSSPEFFSVSKKLCEDVKWLVESLGGVAKIYIKNGKYKNERHTSYRVKIFINTNIFKLKCKAERSKINKIFDHSKKQAIISVKKLDYKEKCRCILVDNPTHLYLTDNFIPTHNTTLLEQLLLYYSINNAKSSSLWVAPVYSITKKTFDYLYNNIIESGIIKDCFKADHFMKFLNDAELVFRSATNYDSIRGGSYDYVFIDEFAFINDDEAWQNAIRPTLAVRGKKAIISSTPKGKNLFYNLCMLGRNVENVNYQYHYMNYAENPYYDLLEVEDARKTLPDKVFRQEYEAQFIDDGGTIFNNLMELAIVDNWEDPIASKRYYAGLDIARQVDFTVLTIMDHTGRVVYVYRANQQSWNIMIQSIISILQRYKPLLLIEVNSIGDPIYEEIRRKYSRVTPFTTTSRSKEEIIENLIMAFNEKSIYLPTKNLMEVFYNELVMFSFEYNKNTRTIRYSAPPGFNDDCLKEGTMIKTISGYRPIEEIKIGDLVLTHLGNYKKVEKCIKKEFNGDFYECKFNGQLPLELSYNHPLYIASDYWKGSKKIGYKNKRQWLLPNELNKSSFNVIIKEEYKENENKVIKYEYLNIQNINERNNLYRDLILDIDFAKFLGLFLADGHASKTGYRIQLAFNKKDKDLIEEMKRYIENILGCKTQFRQIKNGATLVFSSKFINNLLNYCYDESRNKQIPFYFKELGLDLKYLLEYYLKGDGWRSGKYKIAAGISKSLMLDLRDIAINLGRYTTISKRIVERYGKKCKDQYYITISDFKTINSGWNNGNIKTDNGFWIKKLSNYEFGSKYRYINKYIFNGYVYNLQVEDDRSFIADGIVVHNCVMSLALANYSKKTIRTSNFSIIK